MKEVRNDSDYNSSRNVILLTIIAITTMIVVVIGATFAYLANSVTDNAEANITATTNSTNDMFLINAGSSMSISADDQNFGPDNTDLSAMTDASVTLQTATASDVTYRYDISVNVEYNDFEYSSGTCYTKSSVINSATTKAACKSANLQNIWAISQGDGVGKCYEYNNAENLSSNDFYTNSIGCLTNSGNMWEIDETPELFLDLYREDNSSVTNESTCLAKSACIGSDGSIVTSLNQSSCNGENRWLASIYANGSCYKPILGADLTSINVGTGEPAKNINLLSGEMITANAGATTQNYKAMITFRNFEHNQVINGNKEFNGKLEFKRQTT